MHSRWQAPAKVNLRLEVQGRRPDGYHDIRSLAVGIGLFDQLSVTPATAGDISLRCDDPLLATDERNLVVRAARRLAERTGGGHGAGIELSKAIPVAAGLGGGSADAAVTLWALNCMWGTGLSTDELADLGADLGSDVPLFFHLPAALMTGRGEQVEPTRLAWSGWVLLILGEVPVSTADVYAAWQPDDCPPTDDEWIGRMAEARTAEELTPLLRNDLEPAVFRVCPAMLDLYSLAGKVVADGVRISGAGSTLFALFDNLEQARSVAQRAEQAGMRTAIADAGGNTGVESWRLAT